MPTTRSLQEVVLALHFEQPAPLTLLDVAAWVAEFGGPRHTSYAELPSLPPAQIPLLGQPTGQVGIQLIGADGGGILPRLRFNGPDQSTLCVIQQDRLAFGWQRQAPVGEKDTYPGYEALRERWSVDTKHFCEWISDRLDHNMRFRLVELSYNNAFPLLIEGGTRKLSDVVKFFTPIGRGVTSFNATWTEHLDPPASGYVQAIVGIGTAPPALPVIGVNFFGLGALSSVDDQLVESAMQGADKLHGRILDMRKATIHTEA